MKMQTITREGHEFVLVPMKAYEQLLEDAEMLADIRDYREAKLPGEETFPGEVIDRIILKDENPVRVYREYRVLTQQQLADKVGIQRAYLTEIETGRKTGSIKTLKAIAQALGVDLDDIA